MSDEPDIALREGDYLLLAWFFNLPRELYGADDEGGDMMGSVIRPRGWTAGLWRVRWRFRYYRDAKIWGSQDRKNWYGGDITRPATEEEMAASIQTFMEGMTGGAAVFHRARIVPDIFYVRGDAHKLNALVADGLVPEWMHGQKPIA